MSETTGRYIFLDLDEYGRLEVSTYLPGVVHEETRVLATISTLKEFEQYFYQIPAGTVVLHGRAVHPLNYRAYTVIEEVRRALEILGSAGSVADTVAEVIEKMKKAGR